MGCSAGTFHKEGQPSDEDKGVSEIIGKKK